MKRIAFTAILMMVALTAAQAYDRDASWNDFYQQQQVWSDINTRNAINNSAYAQRRNTEALINEMRAARGAPPCAYGGIGYEFLSGLAGKPPCP